MQVAGTPGTGTSKSKGTSKSRGKSRATKAAGAYAEVEGFRSLLATITKNCIIPTYSRHMRPILGMRVFLVSI